MKIKAMKKIVSGFALLWMLALLIVFLPLQGGINFDNGSFRTLVAIAAEAPQYPAGEPSDGDTKMDSDAEETITAQKDQSLTYGDITVRDDLTLYIEAGGIVNVTGSITVDGQLEITGAGRLNVNGSVIVKGDLILQQTTLTMAGTESTVTVSGDAIRLQGATVQYVGFLGFDNSASGEKQLFVEGFAGSSNTLVCVDNVGADDTSAIVTWTNNAITAESHSYQITADYPLTFYGVDQELINESGWLTAYRTVKTVDANKNSSSAFVGIHKGGTYEAIERADTLALPEYLLEGYTNVGWGTTQEDAAGIKVLSVDKIGVTALWTIQTAKKVVIEFDRGYTPNQYSNDDYANLTQYFTAESVVGSVLSDQNMWRFGYAFAGWKIKGGTNTRTLSLEELETYELAVADMTDNGDDTYTLDLEAVWTAETLTKVAFRLEKPSALADLNSIRVKCDCDACMSAGGMTPTEFASAHSGVEYANNTFTFTTEAEYGMTLSQYFNAAGVSGFTMLDSTSAVAFRAWMHVTSRVQESADSAFTLTLGENGLFGNILPSGKTLKTYFNELQSQQQGFVTIFSSNTQTLLLSDKKVWNKDGVWSVYVNGVDRTSEIKNASGSTPSELTEVPIQGTVSFRMAEDSTHYNAAFSLWKITADGERLPVTESVEGGYRIYTFIMPDSQVKADFSGGSSNGATYANANVTFDMKESPVSEQKIGDVYGVWTNELIAHLTPRYDRAGSLGYAPNSDLLDIDLADGWSNGAVAFTEMTYFYELPLTHYYYLTTNDANIDQTKTIEEGNGTHNQWRGGQRPYIYLKDCHMWATDVYSAENLQTRITATEEKTYFDGKMSQVSNLYFYLTDGSLTTSVSCKPYFVGNNNIIGCIGTENYAQNPMNSSGTVDVRVGAFISNNPASCYWSFGAINFYPYAHTTYKDNFGYWIMGFYGDITVSNCKVYLPHKLSTVHGNGAIHLGSNSFFHVRSGRWGAIKSGATLILEEAVDSKLLGFGNIQSTCTVIVRGNVLIDAASNVSGTLIVLGDTFRTATLTVGENGSVIANTIEVQALDVKGSIVANRIRNYSVAGGNQATANGDSGYTLGSPSYVDNTNDAKITYRFLSGNVYLFGYDADDANNPLRRYADGLPVQRYDENKYPVLISAEEFRDAIDSLTANLNDDAEAMYETSKTVNMGVECLELGNSAKDDRRFQLGGTNIYAAGRITFNNTATISSGEIYASALSSKWDLSISGGTVKAEEIGNAAAVQITKADGTKRYAKTEITGGDITADRIGALTTSTASENRSALVVLDANSLTSYTENGNITLVHDALVYYSYTKNFTTDAENFTIRITATYDATKDLTEQVWSLVEPESEGDFATIATVVEGGEAKWSLSSTEGIFVTAYDEDGDLLNNGEIVVSIAGRDNVALYAIEVSYISMSVFQDEGAILSITADGQNVTIENGKVSILSGTAVEVTIDPSMSDKVLLLYRDENKIIHNLFPTVEGDTVTFSMPFRASELHVTSSFTVYLNRHDISISADKPGFRSEATAENADRAFDYAGDIRITRDDEGPKENYKLWIDDKFDNRTWEGKVILNNISAYLNPIGEMNAVMYVDGSAYFSNTWSNLPLEINGTLVLYGYNQNRTDSFSFGSYGIRGRIEKLSFVDLNLPGFQGIFASEAPQEINFISCDITSGLDIIHSTSNANSVVNFNNCNIQFTGTGGGFGNNTTFTLNMTDCTVSGKQGSFFNGNLTLDNTVFTTTVAPTAAQLDGASMSFTNVVLKNGSVYDSVAPLMATNVTVTGGSKLFVGYDPVANEALGRLAARNLTVEDNSELYAKYVVCAGYMWAASPSGHPNDGSNQQGIIVQDGGKIYASEFIGGDANGKVTVLSGGHIESKKIGVYGGYFQMYSIAANRPLIFSQSTYETSVVTISGGSVTVLADGYIGGGKSTVSILDGTVNLQSGSYLGGSNTTVTVTDGKVVGGDIVGKTVELSGASLGVDVNNLEADSLTITGATNEYIQNGYVGGNADHDNVAVFVAQTLQTKEIRVEGGSVVYAELISVYTESGETGFFIIAEGDGSAVYTSTFGVTGKGDVTTNYIPIDEEGKQNIWGIPLTRIIYDLNVPEGDDDPVVTAPTVTYYGLGAYEGNWVLETPSRGDCYVFVGWWDIDEERYVDHFNTNAIDPDEQKRVRADWKARDVVFTVMVTTASSGIDEAYFGLEADYAEANGLGTREGNSFSFAQTVIVPYKGVLYGDGGVFSFNDYQFSTYTFSGMTWKDGISVPLASNTVIDKDMVARYLAEGEKAYLVLTNASSTTVSLTFYLNQTNGKPTDAQFTIEHTMDHATMHVDAGISFSAAMANVGVADVLEIAKAFGYKLLGWSSTQNGTADLDQEATVDPFFNKTWYAVWTPIEYNVVYNAATPGVDGTYYIKDSEPALNEKTAQSETVVTAYDAGLSAPTVWKESAQFVCWFYYDADGVRHDVAENATFCRESLIGLNIDDPVLYADYRYNKIYYHLDGGIWKEKGHGDSVEIENSGEVLEGYLDHNGSIYSTTAEQYLNNGNTYDTEDYRHVLYRTGYTFIGWYTSSSGGMKVNEPARFNDLELYAQWEANTYNVTLLPYASGVSYADGVRFVRTDKDTHNVMGENTESKTLTLTVGQHIDASEMPDRNTWGTTNLEDNSLAARLLWGFTYVPLDPLYSGVSGYDTYLDNLTQLYNVGQMFVRNEVFTLPNASAYESVLGTAYGTYASYVNFGDLPEGSTLTLYATYREFAMIFVQYYLDAEGNPTEVLLKTVPFSDGNFTAEDLATPECDTIEGYQLVNWFINSNKVDMTALYDVNTMNANFAGYQEAAKELGTYDVIIYGIFAANTALNWGVQANTDASKPSAWNFSQFVIPMNMQSGVLTYEIAEIGAGLHIVNLDYLQEYLYQTHFDGYTSNDAIALYLEVTPADGSEKKYHDIQAGGGSTNITVSGGDTVRIYLYHSHVMTQNVQYRLDIHFGFGEGDSVIAGQALNLVNGTVIINPSVYNVTFDANTDSVLDPVISDKGSFTSGDTITANVTLDRLWTWVTLPTIEGHDSVPWNVLGGTDTIRMKDGELVISGLSVDNNGAIGLETVWNIRKYQFTVTSDVTEKWNVNVANGDMIDYRTPITFMPIGEQKAAFILFTYDENTYRLDLSDRTTSNGDGYTWAMPAANVEASFKDQLDLYLEQGAIEIVNDGNVKYSYLDVTVSWPGVFNIYMNEGNTANTPTNNTLTLNGDLSSATINLGNLYIDVDNGIRLSDGARTTLTLLDGSMIKLKNMFIANGAELTVEGQNNTTLELSPNAGFAAIGNQEDGTDSKIILRNGNVTVNELGDYYGTWFGGANVAVVTMEGVALTQIAGQQALGRKITDAEAVTIVNSTVGASSAPVFEPIYADTTLTIDGSAIYQSIGVPLGATSPIGTGTSGSIVIDENGSEFSHIYSAYGSGGRSDAFYTGNMFIHSASSYVCIADVLLLELANGDVEIDSNGVKQGAVTTAHTFDYILLEALLASGEKPNVTVNGIGGSLTLSDPAFVLGTLSVQSDLTVALQGNLTVDKVAIADGGTLTLETDGNTVIMADGALKDSLGAYVQNDGALGSDGAIGGKEADITLAGVGVTAAALYAKNLALNNCTVSCTESESYVGSYGVENGMTTVTLSGNTTITAQTIGALGEKDKTFTEVVANGENVVVAGTLVRDIYRIVYAGLKNGYASAEGSETVLRTEETYNGVVVAAVGNVVVNAPTTEEGKMNRFVTWYLNGENGKIALVAEASIQPDKYVKEFNGFQADGLIAANVIYATEVNGVPTVTVYAFYSISGTVSLKADKQFVSFMDGSNTLTVASDRAWSALLTIEATREVGEDYAVTFDKALPVGTQLMLVWLDRTTDKPMYYYYTVTAENVMSVVFSEFTALGTSTKLNLGSSEKESESFILVVDRISVATAYTLGLGYKADAASSVEELYAVGLTVTTANEKVTIEETESGKITIVMPENELYYDGAYAILVEVDHGDATVQNDLPYTAEPTVTYTVEGGSSVMVAGKLIGGDMILFVLGTYEENMPMTFTITMSLPERYAYEWSVVLLEDREQVNALKIISS